MHLLISARINKFILQYSALHCTALQSRRAALSLQHDYCTKIVQLVCIVYCMYFSLACYDVLLHASISRRHDVISSLQILRGLYKDDDL